MRCRDMFWDGKRVDMLKNVQVLIAAVNQEPEKLIRQMNIQSDAIFVNQCERYETETIALSNGKIQVFHMAERGVGLSRNTALMRATGDVCLFSDQDIIYEDGYEKAILQEFNNHPEADMIVFNIQVGQERQTYYNEQWKKVHWYNCGRYGAVSFAIRRDKLLESGVTFSLLFGGGAKYSAGEDSLFIKQFMDKGYAVYASPVTIGREAEGESTWFNGYTEKFFFDRGVLYHFLYGRLAKLWALRFLYAHRAKMCQQYTIKQAYQMMKQGICSVR